ncbi:MAG: hypothetical protein M5U23_00860 [Acidimicrobiia bacterium]|nr:hypothetical protein [Acidimicrobiia bacterium]
MKRFGKIILAFAIYCGLAYVSAIVIRRRNPEFGDEAGHRFAIVASMDGREFRSTSEGLVEGSALAYMGGIEIDLTAAEIEEGATLTLTAIMGGINVIVPSSWRVEASSVGVMGGVTNETNPDDGDGPLLIVVAKAIMGGVSITDHANETAAF